MSSGYLIDFVDICRTGRIIKEKKITISFYQYSKLRVTFTAYDPLVEDSDPLVASSMRVFCARNSQREAWSLPREGRDHLIQWDVGISVGFSTDRFPT